MSEETVREKIIIEVSESGARVVKGSLKDIGAGANDAKKEVSSFRKELSEAKAALNDIAKAGRTAFNAIKVSIAVITAPLKLMIGLLVTAKASVIAFGTAAIGAAAKYEMFRERLRTVTGSVKAAKTAFEESIKFSVSTPFTPEQIIDTRALLESVNIKGQAAVQAVAEAAAGMNKDISDVAKAVIALESESLRKLGVQAERNGNNTKFKYSTAEQKDITKNVTGFREAQEALLEIFMDKFEGGIVRMSTTMEGLISTLKGATTDFFARFGDDVLESAKLVVKDIIDAMNSIDLSEAGKQFAKWIDEARVNLYASAMVMRDVFKEAVAASERNGIGVVVIAALKSGGVILGQIFLETMTASFAIWEAIGHVIGTAIYNALLQTDLPFSGKVRKTEATRRASALDESQALEIIKRFGMTTKNQFGGQDATAKGLLTGYIDKGTNENMRREMEAAVISMHSQSTATETLTVELKEAGKKIKASADRIGETAKNEVQSFVTTVSGGKGFDVGARYNAYKSEAVQRGETAKKDWEAAKAEPEIAKQEISWWKARTNAVRENLDMTSEAKGVFTGVSDGFTAFGDDVTNTAANMSGIMQGAMNGLAGSIHSMMMSGKADFRSLAASIASEISLMITKILLFKAVSGGMNMLGFGLAPAAAAPTPAAQFGGVMRAGQPTLVGERGPEMFIPPSNGRVVPNAQSSDILGGGGKQQQSIRIVNVVDPAMVNDYMTTPAGERAVLNVLNRNRSALRGVLV